ncbi:hypothetical protein BROC_00555 [Candidatus Brocadiaceae bacterium]|nr:hypothetical protein BROC_00555 [Candidatus Brocadiaceae bacterium]
MGGDLVYEPIGKYAEVQGGFAYKSKDFIVDTGVPVLKIKNIRHRDIDVSEVDKVSEKIARETARFYAKPGDIMISMTGSGVQAPDSIVGRVARYNGPSEKYLINQRVGRFIVEDLEQLEPRYLYYFLSQRSVQWELVSIATGSANQVNISAKQIEDFPIPIREISEQRVIAHILGSLDDKIEINQKTNETLEAMARAIFKSWFVDFDPVRAKAEGRDTGLPKEIADLFPDSFEDSELGEIPKGWRATKLKDGVEIFDNKRIPLNKRQRAERQGPFPYYGAAGIMDYVDDFLFDGVYVLTGEDGSVTDDNGYPVVQYVWGQFWVNNHAHVLKGKNGISDEHLYLFLEQAYIAAFVTGAVQPKLSQKNLKAIPFLLPREQVCIEFSEIVKPLFTKIRANCDENITLAAIRDALLPKLISGELRVKDTEKFAEGLA